MMLLTRRYKQLTNLKENFEDLNYYLIRTRQENIY